MAPPLIPAAVSPFKIFVGVCVLLFLQFYQDHGTVPIKSVAHAESSTSIAENQSMSVALNPSSTRFKNYNGFKNVDDSWRRWLLKKDSNESMVQSIDSVKPATIYSDSGCGVSMKVTFQGQKMTYWKYAQQHQHIRHHNQKGFFKVAYGNVDHYDAETHLKEIKAYYLDQILGTNVVLPCVGFRLSLPKQRKKSEQQKLDEISIALKCLRNSPAKSRLPTTASSSIEGSMMMWRDGVKQTSVKTILQAAFRKTDSDLPSSETFSAMSYAVFHYLGACMKSSHNHFARNQANHNNDPSLRFTAIDNDRCLTPVHVSRHKRVPKSHAKRLHFWGNVTFQVACRLPKPLLNSLAVYGEEKNASDHSQLKVSKMLVSALQEDVLDQSLLAEQPEAFAEIDDRIRTLQRHIVRTCTN